MTIVPADLPPRQTYVGKPCPYCREPMERLGPRGVSREHKVPRSKGGKLTAQNRLIVCRTCNEDKGSFTIEEWHYRLWAGRDPRAPHVLAVLMMTRTAAP